tara:strand:- start:53 stop:718 length:666 start_codon:yes stop_codon:yes gene_type:complete
MAFNLEDYEDVATLNKWLISNYPMFRSDLSVISHDPEKGFILIQATIWRDSKDSAPAVSNVAFGSRETYIQNMKKFYVEDTATSALGRAIILLKGSDKTATKDDMRKVESNPSFKEKLESRQNMYGKAGSKSAQIETILRDSFAADKKEPEPVAWSVGDVVDQIGSAIPNEPPACQHGHILKEGISKGGKPYYGYVCKAKECPPNWATLTANGKWYFKGGE